MLSVLVALGLSLFFGTTVQAHQPCGPCADRQKSCEKKCMRDHSFTQGEFGSCIAACKNPEQSRSGVYIDPKDDSDLNPGGKSPNS